MMSSGGMQWKSLASLARPIAGSLQTKIAQAAIMPRVGVRPASTASQKTDDLIFAVLPKIFGFGVQEHEAWLDEPQELATLDTGKSDPLLGNDTTKADILTPIKEGKEDQVSSKAMDEAVTDSVTQRRVAEKLSQV